MKIFHLLFIGLIFSFAAEGQQHCFTTEVYKELLKEHPEVLQRQTQLEEFTQQYIAGQAQQRTTGTVYVIPVVFHIIHNYGPENISDERVMDAVKILNADFRKLNADTAAIVSSFRSVAADCSIEFRLANLDPNGKCTNGIDRIASLKTYGANNSSKLNQWIPSKYLNIWLVYSLENTEAAAYAYYPGDAPTGADGIIARYDYVGSAATIGGKLHTLTHEVGHYLNLKHTWGDTNTPGVACGDDNVGDTPLTKGWNNECNLSGAKCNAGVIENVQNYMEYSYCTNMFTLGQKTRMTAALNSGVGGRSALWSYANSIATGTNNVTPIACAPKADFVVNHSFVCSGQTVQFTDLSWNGQPTSWSWSLPGASPSTSTDSLPLVYYNTPGTYNATLTVTNSKGSNAVTKTATVIVSGNAVNVVPYTQSFESVSSFPGYDAYLVNPDNGTAWARTTTAGSSGAASFMIKNYNNSNPSGQTDAYITPSFDLSHISQPSLTFKLAYAQRSSTSADRLKVYVSENCGMTWLQKYSKVGATLATAGIISANFVPSNASQWRLETVSLALYAGKPNVRIKFENVSGGGNNVYIDDINITGVVGFSEAELTALNLGIYPNPSHGESTLSFELVKEADTQIRLLDMTGRDVKHIANQKLNAGGHQFTISNNDLAQGMYFVELVMDGSRAVKKLIVE